MNHDLELRLPPDTPRRDRLEPLPRVCYADIGLSFLAGAICALLGFLAVVWVW